MEAARPSPRERRQGTLPRSGNAVEATVSPRSPGFAQRADVLGAHGLKQAAHRGGREEAVPPRDPGGEWRGEEEAVAEEGELVAVEGTAVEDGEQRVVLGPCES